MSIATATKLLGKRGHGELVRGRTKLNVGAAHTALASPGSSQIVPPGAAAGERKEMFPGPWPRARNINFHDSALAPR